ncbi:threonine synthase [Paenibacillus cremeus]|uniref:Threonine synthase n=1 Tax=Paenibacillus cremeus TaxID=2163881 RepID=A0A559K4J3_9BACL|nr:threonine synthase [Paenibacillus cremeus]TVY07036.1 threonine synthase [Paenibacillus cremeus]
MIKCWLTCMKCAQTQPMGLVSRCACGGLLAVEYDLELAKRTLTKEALADRASSMWRYIELLPVQRENAVVSLGEGWTPLIRMTRAEAQLPLKRLYVKREEQNPTGSFKSRGFSSAVSLLHERGIAKAAVPSNGNAASALAAYCARAGMEAYVFVPQDCPELIIQECLNYGAHVYLVDGFIHDAGRIVEEGKATEGWFNTGTMREPGRVEGKKTMGLEMAEQLEWQLPDVIVYPTGGGSGIIGLWKAFRELKELGWVHGELPRLVSVQEAGCQPIVDAVQGFGAGGSSSDTLPTGLRVPEPPDCGIIAELLKQTKGTAVAVTQGEIMKAQQALGKQGISASPEGAATWAGLMRLIEEGWIGTDDSVVLFNTSHAIKYESLQPKPTVPVIRTYANFVHWKRN